jgi:hypothetical protein
MANYNTHLKTDHWSRVRSMNHVLARRNGAVAQQNRSWQPRLSSLGHGYSATDQFSVVDLMVYLRCCLNGTWLHQQRLAHAAESWRSAEVRPLPRCARKLSNCWHSAKLSAVRLTHVCSCGYIRGADAARVAGGRTLWQCE